MNERNDLARGFLHLQEAARGGKGRGGRAYVRDRLGRFASTGAGAVRGTLAARRKVKNFDRQVRRGVVGGVAGGVSGTARTAVGLPKSIHRDAKAAGEVGGWLAGEAGKGIGRHIGPRTARAMGKNWERQGRAASYLGAAALGVKFAPLTVAFGGILGAGEGAAKRAGLSEKRGQQISAGLGAAYLGSRILRGRVGGGARRLGKAAGGARRGRGRARTAGRYASAVKRRLRK